MAVKIFTKYSCSMKLMILYVKKYGPKNCFDINVEIWQNILKACIKSIIDNDSLVSVQNPIQYIE